MEEEVGAGVEEDDTVDLRRHHVWRKTEAEGHGGRAGGGGRRHISAVWRRRPSSSVKMTKSESPQAYIGGAFLGGMMSPTAPENGF